MMAALEALLVTAAAAAPRSARLRSPLPTPAPEAADLRRWNAELNGRHAMSTLRRSGGRVVGAIEARRKGLVADAVLALRPRVVVDVGAEDGWIAEGYAAGVERLVLADIDPAMLAGNALAGRPGVETLELDALDAAPLLARLGPGGADVVVLSALLEHLPEPGRALAALAPVLRPGGAFVVYVPADVPILALKRVLKATRLGRWVRGLPLEPAPGHLQTFTRGSLGRLLRAHGRVRRLTFDPVALGYLAVLAPVPAATPATPCAAS